MKKILLLTAVCGLLAGCAGNLKVTVGNPLDQDRNDEIVEVPVTELSKKGFEDPSKLIVVNKATGKQVASQVTWDGLLIFPADVKAESSSIYIIKEGKAEEYATRVFGRLYPERKDDLTWENDLISFRAYGPALEATGEISSGYDVWVKRTNEMVVDLRYDLEFCEESMRMKKELKESGDEKAYRTFRDSISFHIDHGNGCDYYAVGRTLGCGAMAPYTEGKLWMCHNFTQYQILDKGPLRFTCYFGYAPFEVDGKMVVEDRIVSLNAGTHFNKATVLYTNAETGENENLTIASGIVLHGTEDYVLNNEAGCMYYADPVHQKFGQTYLGVIFPEGNWETKVDCNHLLAITEQTPEKEVSYYFGAGWNKFGFPTPDDWGAYVENQAKLLKSPLKVSFK